jgi:HK97 family phage prohead protease
MKHKSFTLLETKADGDAGEFTALVSTFGNVDRVGDRILPGAYTKTLVRWRASGDPIPIILSHKWDDPMAHIGVADPQEVRETPRGLLLKGRLDIEDNPVAKQVHKLMQRRSLKEFSIGYSVPSGGESLAKDGANEISEIELVEAGPTLKGIDPKTELRGVKAALGVEPPSEQDLRRRSELADRSLQAADLPDDREASSAPPLGNPELDAVKAELDELRGEVEASMRPQPSEAELRRRSDHVDRGLVAETLPTAPEAASVPDEVTRRMDTLDEKLDDLKAALEARPPPSEQELRRRSDRVERGLTDLPDETAADKTPNPLAGQVDALATQVDEMKAMLEQALVPPPSEADLRRASDRLERADIKAQLPSTEPLSDLLASTNAQLAVSQAQLSVLKAMPDFGKRGKRLASDLRERLDAAGTERFGGQDTYVYVDDFDLDQGWVVYYVAGEAAPRRYVQLDYVADSGGVVTLATDEVEVVRTTSYRPMDGSAPKSEGLGPTRVRPADPLRKRSDQAVLEIQSDGASLRKPPQVIREPEPETLDASVLRRRSREVMLATLNGETA